MAQEELAADGCAGSGPLDTCHRLIAALDIPVLILDDSLRCLHANPCFHETFRLDETDIAGVPLAEVDNGLFRTEELRILLENLRSGTGESFGGIDCTFELHSQGARTFSTSGTRLEHETLGRLLLLSMRDVTEERLARRIQRDSDAKYRVLYESSRDAVMMLAPPNWRFIAGNPATLRLFRCRDESEFATLGPWDLSPPFQPDGQRSAEVAGRTIQQAMENGSVFFEWTHQRLDGEEFQATVLLNRIEQEGRMLLQAMVREHSARGTDQDTEQGEQRSLLEELVRSRTAELRESEEKYRSVVEQVSDGIFIELEGSFLFVNEGMCLLTGRSRGELYSLTLADIVHPEDRVRVAERSAPVRNGAECPGTLAMRIRGRTGELLHVESSLRPITYHGKPALLGICRDISDAMRRTEEGSRIQRLEALGTLAGGIAHDFNNFLTVILGNTSLARMMVEPGSGLHELLTETELAAASASTLTERLLTFSTDGEPVRSELRVADFLEETVRGAVSGTGVIPDLRIPEDVWSISADQDQIGQAIRSILENAVQAMPSGGTVTLRASNSDAGRSAGVLPEQDGFVRIEIEDEGPGIPGEILPRIFDPFFTTRDSASGLGLTTAYSIISRHGGRIRAENLDGGGSRFTVFLPACGMVPERLEGDPEALGTNGGRVLVMDDKAMVRRSAAVMLDYLGYEVQTAGDGGEAVRLYRLGMEEGRRFDAVILDLTVPGGMDGRETLAELRRIDPSVRAAISSGYPNDPVISEHRQLGFRGAVLKPYSLLKLAAAMREITKD